MKLPLLVFLIFYYLLLYPSTVYLNDYKTNKFNLFQHSSKSKVMSDEKEIIENFYAAFARFDAETMVSYYRDDVHFEDPAFGKLKGERAKNMWRMLCESLKKDSAATIVSSSFRFEDNVGYAHWEADYVFSATGRKVHNVIDATFLFKDGKISEHIDNFDLHKWSKQALGLPGILLGKTQFFKKKLNQKTNKLLLDFENRKLN